MNATLCGKAMFRSLAPLLLLLLTVTACTGLKPLVSVDPARKTDVLEKCRRPFLPERYRLVHALETETPDGGRGTAIGVLVADPRTRGFRTVMMTIEGFVLFDAEAGETLIVHRAVPPFDKPAFAEGLAGDLRLAFFPPGGEPTSWGAGEGGAPACRYGRADGGFVEVLTKEDGGTIIRLYNAGHALLKTVTTSLPEKPGLAETLEIRGGWPPYLLRLRLLESDALNDHSDPNPAGTLPGAEPSGSGNENGKGKKIP